MPKPIKIVFSLVICSGLILFSGSFSLKRVYPSKKENAAMKIVFAMLDSIRAIKSMSFHLKSLERVDDKVYTAESDIKINSNPKMIYFHSPKKKISVFWKEGSNNGNALVKARMTFNTTLSLDPYGN